LFGMAWLWKKHSPALQTWEATKRAAVCSLREATAQAASSHHCLFDYSAGPASLPHMDIDGFCDARFSTLREAFAQNFASRGEPGAAIALCVVGRVVADLWGGWRDAARTQRWQRDTLVNFFSVSKALCAIVALRLVARGAVP